MSLQYQTQKIKQVVLVSANCDRCGDELCVQGGEVKDGTKFQYNISWHHPHYPCGDIRAVVCETCIIEIFHFGEFTQDAS